MKNWTFDKPLTVAQMQDAINEAAVFVDNTEGYERQKYALKFRNPVKVRHNSKTVKTEKTVSLSFFESTSGRFCYSARFRPRHGYFVTEDMAENLESITVYADSDLYTDKKVRQFVAKFHPNLWQNIRDELNADPSKMESRYYNNYRLTSITRKFPTFVLNELRKAIEEKKDYEYKTYGEKRDLSVTTKMCEDGVFRAWFSSEYAGCGNGAYYLLINPTTAAFCEYD